MDAQFIADQKQKLESKKIEINKEIDRLTKEDAYLEESKEAPGRDIDEYYDDASEDTQHSNTETLVSALKEELSQVEKALKAIQENRYGVDENTGETISQERLLAYPEATTSK